MFKRALVWAVGIPAALVLMLVGVEAFDVAYDFIRRVIE